MLFFLTQTLKHVENDNSARFESVYSTKVRAGRRRTYFFDVRKTKGGDFYVTLTESTKKFNGEGYDRHKIFLYKEDFNRFMNALNETVNHVKTDLMPDYDYEQFERRQEEWEAKKAADEAAGIVYDPTQKSTETASSTEESTTTEADTTSADTTSADVAADPVTPEDKPSTGTGDVSIEDDMAW